VKHFPSDTHKLAEMEFYLIDDLECNLTVFHPYRTLLTLCCKEGSAVLGVEAELGELGAGVDDGPRYWGTGEGRLELHESALQMAWLGLTPSDDCSLTHTIPQAYHQRHVSLRYLPDIPTAYDCDCRHLSYTRIASHDKTSYQPSLLTT
jgi:hypothetical protein